MIQIYKHQVLIPGWDHIKGWKSHGGRVTDEMLEWIETNCEKKHIVVVKTGKDGRTFGFAIEFQQETDAVAFKLGCL